MSAYYHEVQTRDLQANKDAFDSFFRREGRRLAGAEALHRRAVASIGERAYWSALSHIFRGKVATGVALMKLAIQLRPLNAAVPPINYLLRMDRPFQRVRDVVFEMARSAGRP